MSQEEPEERRVPTAPLGHRYEQPIVKELRRETPHSARDHIDAAKGDMPAGSADNTSGLDAP
jgi:hypothetical protein